MHFLFETKNVQSHPKLITELNSLKLTLLLISTLKKNISAILGTAGLVTFVLVIGISRTDYRYNWSMILSAFTISGLYVSLFLIMVGNKKPPTLQVGPNLLWSSLIISLNITGLK